MKTNNSFRVRDVSPLVTIGVLVALGLFLTACGVSAGNTATPTVAPIPISPLPSITPTLPFPTSMPDSIATPTALPSSPDPAGYDWAPVITGLNLPLDIQNAGDGSGRVFVVEKPGHIFILLNDQLLPTPFLDITNKVGSQATEQGLLGLAFHPDYSSTGLFFVNYTDVNGNTVIARFHVSADDPNRADPTSEVDLLHVDQPYANHNGGGLAFGPDGYLYIGLGDGGSGGDPLGNGQNLRTLLGKLLRIDVDHGEPYAIPVDNPFAGGGGLPEIWAYGLRNPWRFSFDRLTGNLYIADVGQDEWEEVDYVPAGPPGGLNFGWSYEEGNHLYKGQPPADATLIAPVVEYSHASGCSITGGYVYRGSALPEWQGVYFYGDYCSGTVWGLISTGENAWQPEVLFTTSAQIDTFGVDEAGEIYLADYGSGTLLRLSRKE
jgi:glucose/arabinose dehydrogenase